jgi:hypothetical protein
MPDPILTEAARSALEAEYASACEAMRVFPRMPNGLTPDSVKALPEYRSAKDARDKAFAALRAFNKTNKPTRKPRYAR